MELVGRIPLVRRRRRPPTRIVSIAIQCVCVLTLLAKAVIGLAEGHLFMLLSAVTSGGMFFVLRLLLLRYQREWEADRPIAPMHWSEWYMLGMIIFITIIVVVAT